jgi:hypothetical protein
MSKTAEMHEGQAAFNRFRKAMKTIVAVPKSAVSEPKKTIIRKKKPAR